MTRLLDGTYEKGVKVCGDEKTEFEQHLQRVPILHWWDITIQPETVIFNFDIPYSFDTVGPRQ